jgi:cytochrome c553
MCREGGLTVRRTLWTLVAMGICLPGAALPVTAQEAQASAVTVCLPCHGGAAAAAPAAPAAPTFPTLNGQHADYLEKQLREYRSGKRKSAVMTPLIGTLKTQQIRAMAAHFASQTPARGAVQNADLAARGKVLYEQGNRATGVPGCIGCHLPNGTGSQRYPRLAGQLQTYTVQQLVDFKSGARSNDRARVMRHVAGRLSDEEMRAVAEYVAGLQ